MPGVVLLLGEERLLAQDALRRVLADHPDLEVDRFDGETTSAARVLDEVRTPTLLGGGRAVVVDRAEAILDGESLEAVARYARRPVPGALLVLLARKLDGRRKAAKALKKEARVERCDPLREFEVEGWIRERAKEAHGIRMDPAAASALRRRVGEDLGLLDAAMERLRQQIAPRTRLDASEILDTTDAQRSPVLFEVTNCLEQADLAGALRAVAAAFDDGIRVNRALITDPAAIAPILLANLHNGYVRLLRFHMQRAAGASEKDALRAIGVTNPKAWRIVADHARRHRPRDLVERHRCFVDADLELKSGRTEPRRVLEGLLVGLVESGA